MLSNLIKALEILLKYGDPSYPTHCEHDIMYICGINPVDVSKDDTATLEELGFFIDTENDECFASFRYGSA